MDHVHDKRWQLPLWFLLFSSSFPTSACPTQALRRLWCFCRLSKFFLTWKLGSHLAMSTDDRFLPQGKQILPKICQVRPMSSSVQRTIFFTPVIAQCMKKDLDITKPRYSEQILPVPWPFVISRFHCNYKMVLRILQIPWSPHKKSLQKYFLIVLKTNTKVVYIYIIGSPIRSPSIQSRLAGFSLPAWTCPSKRKLVIF